MSRIVRNQLRAPPLPENARKTEDVPDIELPSFKNQDMDLLISNGTLVDTGTGPVFVVPVNPVSEPGQAGQIDMSEVVDAADDMDFWRMDPAFPVRPQELEQPPEDGHNLLETGVHKIDMEGELLPPTHKAPFEDRTPVDNRPPFALQTDWDD